MVVLTAETCWAMNEYWINYKISGTKLVFLFTQLYLDRLTYNACHELSVTDASNPNKLLKMISYKPFVSSVNALLKIICLVVIIIWPTHLSLASRQTYFSMILLIKRKFEDSDLLVCDVIEWVLPEFWEVHMSEGTHPATENHIPEDWHHQLHYHENAKVNQK